MHSHGRHYWPAVPRIRRDADFRDFYFARIVSITGHADRLRTSANGMAAPHQKEHYLVRNHGSRVVAENTFNWLQHHYDKGLQTVMRHQILTLLFMLLTICLTIYLYIVVPKGFFPQQDTGNDAYYRSAHRYFLRRKWSCQGTRLKITMADPAVAALGSSVGAGGFNASRKQRSACLFR